MECADLLFDGWMLKDGLSSMFHHSWGHLSIDQAVDTVASHAVKVQNTIARYEFEYPTQDTIKPLAARELRAQMMELLRANKYCQTVVNMKIPRISLKHSGVVEREYLGKFHSFQRGLIKAEGYFTKELHKIDALHPASRMQTMYQGLLNFGSKLKRTTYQYRVSSGIFFGTMTVVLPLVCLYQDAEKAKAAKTTAAGKQGV